MKDRVEMSDVEFKVQAADTLKRQYEVELAMDNEAENVVLFSERLPKARSVFFHSVMSGRIPARTWTDALGDRDPWRLNSFQF